jgi:hypothetical protein
MTYPNHFPSPCHHDEDLPSEPPLFDVYVSRHEWRPNPKVIAEAIRDTRAVLFARDIQVEPALDLGEGDGVLGR